MSFNLNQMVWNIAGGDIAKMSQDCYSKEETQESILGMIQKTGVSWNMIALCVAEGIALSSISGDN